MSRSRLLSVLALSAWALGGSSCSPGGFADPAVVSSVRILASSADKPYAHPGDQVTVRVLAPDGRPHPSPPRTIFWLRLPCENPEDDAYFACFRKLAQAGANPAMAGGLFATGESFQFTVPADAVTSHAPTPGVNIPYGLVILFNMACAGHVEPLPIDPNNINPQALPIGCFDDAHNQLGADSYVFGFTRVYVYADPKVTNTNPAIDSVYAIPSSPDCDGGVAGSCPMPAQPDMPAQADGGAYHVSGFHMSRCRADRRENCAHVRIGPVVPESSWELNPEDVDGRHEQIWADYFTTLGDFKSDARLLYDAVRGSLGDPSTTGTEFRPPSEPGSGTIWIVVHDNRGGASWVTIPVTID